MTPEQFIAKWRPSTRSERSAAHEHFLDLCELLEVPKPGDIDPHGTEYTFDKLTKRLGRGKGFADAWKNGCFEWEYKGPRKNLVVAYAQLKQYADDLGNPPLLIVSDMKEIRVHTNFTGMIGQEHVILLPDLVDPGKRDMLRRCFEAPYSLKPTATRESVTAEAAARFARIAVLLRQHHDERRVAHFINKLVFCLFAEDIGLLPNRIFAEIIDEGSKHPEELAGMLRDLFHAMGKKGGRFGTAVIRWFNGGLFDDEDVLPVGPGALGELAAAARLDWGAIDPTIFGTLFEGGLDEKRRAEMASLFDRPDEQQQPPHLFERTAPGKGVGIHYTDPATIMKIIEPVVVAPLRSRWETVKGSIRRLLELFARTRKPIHREKARTIYAEFRKGLGSLRVLDPACGSGNFLALALIALKDLDRSVVEDAKALELPPDDERVGPEAVMGIEINAYAAELARLTVWISELQWQVKNYGVKLTRVPVLSKLDGIVCRDALVNTDGSEARWPEADVIIGNPPFLGGKLMRKSLGDVYVDRLFTTYAGRVPAEADLVTYWFAKAWEEIRADRLRRAGLVATNSIRGGPNRRILDRIAGEGVIFDAWSDEPWVVDGVAVRVSLVCFSPKSEDRAVYLDGRNVQHINANLTATTSDLTTAQRLAENQGVAFMGDTKGGAFDVRGELARQWLSLPLNPNRRPNSDVLRPWMNGMDITRRPADKWIVDFGSEMDEAQAALYEAPFQYAVKHILPFRKAIQARGYAKTWWRHERPRPEMWEALKGFSRYIATPTIAKHRVFVRLPAAVCPDHQLIVIARDDDTTFGILQSRLHEAWALGLCSWLGIGNDPRYTPSTTFETFPFPEGLTPNQPAASYAHDPRALAIAHAAQSLDERRRQWLNPEDAVQLEREVVPGFPDRVLPRLGAAKLLASRTLTKLYNERPMWLVNAHRDLDAAVAAAYGWPADITDEDSVTRLLELNHARASRGRVEPMVSPSVGRTVKRRAPPGGSGPQPDA